jgi:aminoglycoside 2''-phosphotransferase
MEITMKKTEVPADYRSKIIELLPQTASSSFKFVTRAGCYTDAVLIDDNLIALFGHLEKPFSPERTLKISDLLRSHITMFLPDAVAKGENCIVFNKFYGSPFYRRNLQALPIKTQKKVADQLGEFLAELQSVPLEIFANLSLQDRRMDHTLEIIEQTIDSFIEKVHPKLMYSARAWIEEHCQSITDKELTQWQPVLQHGELAPPHIYFNEEKEKISGILDFGEAGIGDPADELFWLIWSYGQTFVDQVVANQPSLQKHYKRARFLTGFQMIRWSLAGVEGGPAQYTKLLTLPFDFEPLRMGE